VQARLPDKALMHWSVGCAAAAAAAAVAAAAAAAAQVGTDPRISGPLLKPALITGLLDAGAEVSDVQLASTPAMFYSIIAPGAWGIWGM
jgi:phosphomannomutase